MASARIELEHGNEGRAQLLEALEMVQPSGYLRTFSQLTPKAVDVLFSMELSEELSAFRERIRAFLRPGKGTLPTAAPLEPPLEAPAPHEGPGVDAFPEARQVNGEVLTDRECEILQCLADGMANKDIAEELALTVATVKWYVSRLLETLRARNRTEAVARARRLGLLR